MEIIPDKRKVIGLVEQAYEGKICLPNFQRDFVWTREEVADLVRSIVRGYFIGSLLLLRCDREQPAVRARSSCGAQSRQHREPRPELLILDGQQRLSSLIYALTAPDLSLKDSSQRRWFFVNLDVLLARAGQRRRRLRPREARAARPRLAGDAVRAADAALHGAAHAAALLPVARRLRGLAAAARLRTSSTSTAQSGATAGRAP